MKRAAGRRAVGITSTVPLEVIFAAGLEPVDLNNRFITHRKRRVMVERAEASGFPVNICAWIKGIYEYAIEAGIRRVVGVRQGDCSNTHALMEAFEDAGIETIPFDYPVSRDAGDLRKAIAEFARWLGTNPQAAEKMRRAMSGLRGKLEYLDELTWREGKVTGTENHIWLINSSDMQGNWKVFEKSLDGFLDRAGRRRTSPRRPRLGFVGIPPVVDDLHEVLESRGAAVVYNEFQRQFSMPGKHGSLVEQYLSYTYPYGTSERIKDIANEAARRKLDGVVHYVQSFCFRQLADRAVRNALRAPVLTLECDRPGQLDARSLTRVEAFLELVTTGAAQPNR